MSLRVSMSSWFSLACSGDMYSIVPTTWPNSVNIVFSVRRWAIALAMPKSITLGTGVWSYSADEDVRGLEVAVDDPFLMGVLDGLANRNEQLQPLAGRELMVVAELRDRNAFD